MSLIPIWRALLALPVAGILGGMVLMRAGLPRGPAELFVRALFGVALIATLTVHVAIGFGLAVIALVLTEREREARDREASELPARPFPWLVLAAIVVVAIVAAVRPAVPLFWDESVWLTKTRVACAGPRVLMARALDPASDLVPRGYPIIAAVIQAWLALGDTGLASIVAGGAALVISSFALFALLLARSASSTERAATLVILAATPLFWVHLRCVQLDLPVGLLAASLLLAIERALARDPIGLPAAMTAALLLGIKDEGLACAIAVAAAVLLTERDGVARRASLAAVGALALVTAGYRLQLWLAGSANEDHSIGEPSLGEIPDLAREALRHAVDLRTWGIVPPVALASTLVGLRSGMPRATRRAALALVFAFGGLGLALVLGPAQVRVFALEGTLLNRLGLELLPIAAVLVPRALLVPRSDRVAEQASRSKRVEATGLDGSS